jgi:hypothetical protein
MNDGYPVRLSVDYPDRQLNRLTTAFRIFTVIPIAFVLGTIGGYSGGWGDGVTSEASYLARRTALRNNPLSTIYINWPYLENRYQNNPTSGANIINLQHAFGALHQMGIEPVVEINRTNSGYPWDPAGTTACVEPEPEAWFTGVGAGPEHSSVLELVNPDKGPAVADVTVLTPTGVADVSALRGIRVPGASSLTFDLGRLAAWKHDLKTLKSLVEDLFLELKTAGKLPAGAKKSASHTGCGLADQVRTLIRGARQMVDGLDRAIGMGYVAADRAEPGTEITIDLRGRPRRARIVRKPFYKREE